MLPPRSMGTGPRAVVRKSLGLTEVNPKKAALCGVYVLLSSSGPIMFDWVKRGHGGKFPFSVPALTFHAWGIAALLGLCWTASRGKKGWQMLNRPDMLWRFCITTSMFAAGDMLSFESIQHLDVGTFSLVGKALAIVVTVFMSRVVLKRHQSTTQYVLVAGVAAATMAFCHSEMQARDFISPGASGLADIPAHEWFLGLVQRSTAVCITCLGAVLQERLLTREPGIPFLVQQSWMGCGAMLMCLLTMKWNRLPLSVLTQGFDNWRVLILLSTYVANGLAAGLMVKRLGAVAKALCVPIYLGGCYAYAVRTGSACLSVSALLAWFASTVCILLYAVQQGTAAAAWQRGVNLPK